MLVLPLYSLTDLLSRREAMDKVRVLLRIYPQFLTGVASTLDLLEDFMALRKIPYARLDGSKNRPRRNLDIRLVTNIRLIQAHLIIVLLVPTREIAYAVLYSLFCGLTALRQHTRFS